MSKVFEEFFDDINDEDIVSTESEYESDNWHTIVLCVSKMENSDWRKVHLSKEQLKTIIKHLNYFCSYADMFESFNIKTTSYTDDLTEYIDINDLPKGNYSKIRICVKYIPYKKLNMNMFVNTIQKLAALLYNIITEKFNYRLETTALSLNIDNDNGLVLRALNPDILKDDFHNITDTPIVLNSHGYIPKDRLLHINNNIRLSEKSIMKLDECGVGDILYSTKKGELVLDSETDNIKNTPIAIYLQPEPSWHTFVSIKFLSNMNPKYGSIVPIEMYFGMYQYSSNQRNCKKNDPKSLLQCLYDYLNEYGDKAYANNHFVVNRTHHTGSPVIESCFRYSPIGTKKGDWYLPTINQLKMLYDNKELIDNTRKKLGLEELPEFYFYSCEETSDKYISVLDMGNMREDRYFGKNQCNDTTSIAFINIY